MKSLMLNTIAACCRKQAQMRREFGCSHLFLAATVAVMMLASAALSSAADSSFSASAVTNPSGTLWLPGALGGHLWIADHAQGFCRLDPTPPGSASPLAI